MNTPRVVVVVVVVVVVGGGGGGEGECDGLVRSSLSGKASHFKHYPHHSPKKKPMRMEMEYLTDWSFGVSVT